MKKKKNNSFQKLIYSKFYVLFVNMFYSIIILFIYCECNETKDIDENNPLETDNEKNSIKSQEQTENSINEINSDSNIEENFFEKEFSNPKNVIEEGYSYVSFDNINTAKAARLIVPKNKKIKNIFSLLDKSEENKKEFVNIFKILSNNYKNGLLSHNTQANKESLPMDMIVINTNVFCSKPNLLHVQEYSGHSTVPYNEVSKIDFTKQKAVIENDNFLIYEIPTFVKNNGLSYGKILMYKDTNKTFDDFFNEMNSTKTIQNDFIDILRKYENFAPNKIKIHKNTRMIITPNKSKDKKYDNYSLPNNKFSIQLHATNDSSPPLYESI